MTDDAFGYWSNGRWVISNKQPYGERDVEPGDTVGENLQRAKRALMDKLNGGTYFFASFGTNIP